MSKALSDNLLSALIIFVERLSKLFLFGSLFIIFRIISSLTSVKFISIS